MPEARSNLKCFKYPVLNRKLKADGTISHK